MDLAGATNPITAKASKTGPGRRTWYTQLRPAYRGHDYGVGFCGGKQECERRRLALERKRT